MAAITYTITYTAGTGENADVVTAIDLVAAGATTRAFSALTKADLQDAYVRLERAVALLQKGTSANAAIPPADGLPGRGSH